MCESLSDTILGEGCTWTPKYTIATSWNYWYIDTFTAEINSTAALRLDNLNKKKFDFVKGELYRINLLFLLLIFEFENENVFVLSNDF